MTNPFIDSLPVLSLLIATPVLGGIMLLFVQSEQAGTISRIRVGALWISILNALISLSLFFSFDPQSADLQFTETYRWLEYPDISYRLGVDGLSFFFIQLNNLLLPLCILCSWKTTQKAERSYFICFMLLVAAVNGMFLAQDLLLFYIFFEAVLIPMFIIIGVWGGPERVYATFKFILYTFFGSVFMLLAVIFMIYHAGTGNLHDLQLVDFPVSWQIVLFLAFFAAFAVKVPMWPFHTWLPDAHVQAPTAGSVMLAAILLKMGGYGLIRFNLTLLPEASELFAPFVLILSAIAVIYASAVALVQTDIKKLIAYSSVAHMGFVTAGIFSMHELGLQGAVVQMLSHGVVSAALFLIVGVVYDREHSRDIAHYQGLAQRMPNYALIFMIFMFASVALPGTSGFVGEILVIVAMMQTAPWIALFLAMSMVLGAAYMLYLYRRIIFGTIQNVSLRKITDLSYREIVVFSPLIVFMFAMGLFPSLFIDYIHPTLFKLLTFNY